MAGNRSKSWLAIVGPGMLTAATGVGAGDLATGAFSGSKLGLAVLWVVIVGAAMKFVLTEGLARWQLVTGDTLLEGVIKHGGLAVYYVFLIYLFVWSYFVGAALMSAAGIAVHALLPLFSPNTDKIVYGIAQSLVAVVLIRRGGFAMFGKLMAVLIAIMFIAVLISAIAIAPEWPALVSGLVPTIPDSDGEGLQWTLALMGGIGGTMTILCYGYWIAEEQRTDARDLGVCRIDLCVAYSLTAIFGLCMVLLGSRIVVEGKGAQLLVQLGNQLDAELGTIGPAVRWIFLIGAWAAIFSSLLGVWQSVPYLFADAVRIGRKLDARETQSAVDTKSRDYRIFLYCLATVPAIGMTVSFEFAQKAFAIVGAFFLPLLALALICLNGSSRWIGKERSNGWLTNIVLIATLLFFVGTLVLKVFNVLRVS